MLQQPRLAEQTAPEPVPVLLIAAALALAAAVSLGLSRFSYALLLPPMRADLGWSYLTAGSMNTVNAAGYLAGALLLPWALRRFSAALCCWRAAWPPAVCWWRMAWWCPIRRFTRCVS